MRTMADTSDQREQPREGKKGKKTRKTEQGDKHKGAQESETGQPVADQPTTGQPTTGQPTTGQTVAGQTDAGQTDAGKPTGNSPTGEAPSPTQKLGDTPVAPWNMPAPEEKAQVEPVRAALETALSEVDSQAKADAVIEELETRTAGQKTKEVAATEPTPATPAEAAQKVQAAVDAAPNGESAPAALEETAKVVAAATGKEREAVAQAAQEVFNVQQQGAGAAAAQPQQEQEREYLRRAVLKRLKPLDALDANLFIRINHLPHTLILNRIFYTLTYIFTGGAAWFVLMGLIWLRKPKLGARIIRETAAPLAIATWLVEHPVKRYFRRRRPFIAMIQAIVIGKKPGTWSFPSGHAATAFAGAWLLSRYFRKQQGFLYTIASLVAFSRVYLGDHYPGDVTSGSIVGTALAAILHWLIKPDDD
jgi:membrane-associated phospholipid phosphatase